MQAKLLTIVTILQSTIATISYLEEIEEYLVSLASNSQSQHHDLLYHQSPKMLALKSRRQDCTAYVASVQIMQSRTEKLINLVQSSDCQKLIPVRIDSECSFQMA